MDQDELARRIRLGEDSALEFKQVLLARDRVAERKDERNRVANELSGMANGRGGTMVFGVDDESREILGIPVNGLDAVEAWVRENLQRLREASARRGDSKDRTA